MFLEVSNRERGNLVKVHNEEESSSGLTPELMIQIRTKQMYVQCIIRAPYIQ